MKRADAVCSAFRAQTPALVNPRSYDAIVRWGSKALPLYAGALRKLEALQPPSSDERQARRWLAADRRVQRAIHELVAAAQKRDFGSVSAAASAAQLAGSQSRAAAQTLGLQVCGTIAPTGR